LWRGIDEEIGFFLFCSKNAFPKKKAEKDSKIKNIAKIMTT
jgi:hypothetical protein